MPMARQTSQRFVFIPLLVAAALPLALPCVSAVSAAEAPPKAPAGAAPKAAAAPKAPAAEAKPATEAPAVINAKAYGDWSYSCTAPTASLPSVCSIQQQLSDPQTRGVVFIWRILRQDSGTLVSDWQTPTGILVNRGLVLEVGTPQPVTLPYTSCTNQHCDAIANLAPDFVGGLATTAAAKATVYGLNGTGITFTFSVKGLKEGLDALQK